MDYNLLFQKLKHKYVPELKDREVFLVKKKQRWFMVAPFVNNKVYYNEDIMKRCNPKARDAALVHELIHKLQAWRMNFFIVYKV